MSARPEDHSKGLSNLAALGKFKFSYPKSLYVVITMSITFKRKSRGIEKHESIRQRNRPY